MGGPRGNPFRLDAPWIDLRGKLPVREGAAGYQRRDSAEMDAVRWIVFHHSGAGPARPSVWSTAAYHAGPSPLGAPSICYHVYIEADGAAYLCHSFEEVTWHSGSGSTTSKLGVGSNNWESVGVCLAGEHPTPEQLVSARRVAVAIDSAFERRLERRAHYEVSVGLTECPGYKWPEWRAEVGG